MKSYIHTLMLVGILGVTSSCYAQTENANTSDTNTSIEEVKKESQDLLHAISSYTADKKDEAVQKAKDGLDNLDERIDTLESKIDKNWDEMSETARQETRESMRNLRKQRNKVAEWYGSMKTSSADAWEHMKKGFSDAYKVLEDAWEKSEKEFESKE
ncbi:hypothetical protein [Sulfurovum sp. TSL1]|uniref:hypothetical protein n=1 Tax=Sulfurovum sp. TSL1 TaxID=2826994 RepID=UPI001CC7EEFC|nr:hypothetical protein [Sulfurovum sp. TSL1]GIT97758.1 hypothetical protein TSL1_05790 [Sulfurovum sp. TSL1]